MTLRTPRICAAAGLVRCRTQRDRTRSGRRALRGRDHAGARRADRPRPIRTIRSRGNSCPTPPNCDIQPDERADPIGDDAHSPGRRHRASLSRPRAAEADACLRGLLPLLLPPRDGRAGQADGALAARRSTRALAYIAAHPEIWEVILTGGDPLVLSPRRLREILTRTRRHRRM